MTEENLELGGNINLEGFNDVDASKMVVIKKMVGNYVKVFSEETEEFKGLRLTQRNAEKSTEGNYEIEATLELNDQKLQVDICDSNIFFCIDNALKELENRYKTN